MAPVPPPPSKPPVAVHRTATAGRPVAIRAQGGTYLLQIRGGKATLVALAGQAGSGSVAAACRAFAADNAPELRSYSTLPRARTFATGNLADRSRAFLPNLTPDERSRLSAFTVIEEHASGAKDYSTYIDQSVAETPGRCVASDIHELFHIFLEETRGALSHEYSELLAYGLSVGRLSKLVAEWRLTRPGDVAELELAVSKQEEELGKLIQARQAELTLQSAAVKRLPAGTTREQRAQAVGAGWAELSTIRAEQAARLRR